MRIQVSLGVLAFCAIASPAFSQTNTNCQIMGSFVNCQSQPSGIHAFDSAFAPPPNFNTNAAGDIAQGATQIAQMRAAQAALAEQQAEQAERQRRIEADVKLRLQCDGATVPSDKHPDPQSMTFVIEVVGDYTVRARVTLNAQTGGLPMISSRVDDDAIYGQFRINMFDKPVFRIDRTTGLMTVTNARGIVRFNGSCQQAALDRKF